MQSVRHFRFRVPALIAVLCALLVPVGCGVQTAAPRWLVVAFAAGIVALGSATRFIATTMAAPRVQPKPITEWSTDAEVLELWRYYAIDDVQRSTWVDDGGFPSDWE